MARLGEQRRPARDHVPLGTPVPLASLACGDIDPLGITSSPVYERTSGSLLVVAEISGPRHVLFALAVYGGTDRATAGSLARRSSTRGSIGVLAL